MERPTVGQSFGALLRAHRTNAGLTQERLAERAGMSRRGIADLERGARRSPYASTVDRLANALGLSESARTELVAATRRIGAAKSPGRIFVGRRAELQQLQEACYAAVHGAGNLLLLTGEPGIGKTALCEQLTAYAETLGACSLAGHCYEEGSLSIPYLPFVEALRSYFRTRTSDELRDELGFAANDLMRVIPELEDRLEVEPRSLTTPEEDRWRLLGSFCDAFCGIALRQPLVLILEDLQWADRASLDLLAVLCRRVSGARVLVVGTYRDVEVDRSHPLSAALVELRRVSAFRRITLRGLSLEEVRELVRRITGQHIAEEVSLAVHQRTEGNALFVEEVARHLMEAGESTAIDGIPEGLRDVIGRRLNRLSPACNLMLGIAAVIGREFSFGTLRRVVTLDEEVLMAALEEARVARVLEDRTETAEVRFTFSHALFRETLYLEMFTPRRLKVHQAVARALEQQYAARVEEHAAELADHFGHSTDANDLHKALQYSELAADRANSVYAYAEAVRHLRRALEVLQLLPEVDPAKKCDLLLALGYAMNYNGQRVEAAQEVAPEALRLAEALSDRTRAFHASVIGNNGQSSRGAGGFLAPSTGRNMAWVDLLDRYAEPGTAERVHTDVLRVMRLRESGREDDGRRLNLEALRLAREINDAHYASWAACRLAEGWVEPPQRQQERLDVANEFAPWLREGYRNRINLSHGAYESMATFTIGDIYLTWGMRQRAEAIWARLAQRATQTNLPWFTLIDYRTRLMLACVDGEFDRVFSVIETLESGSEAFDEGLFGRSSAAAYSFRTRLYIGAADEALSQFPEHVRDTAPADVRVFGITGVLTAQRALCLAHAGRLAEAIAIVDKFLEVRQIGQPDDSTCMPILVALLEAAVLAGHKTAAERLVVPLGVAAHLVASDNSLTVVARHLGAATALLGHREQAYAYSEQALRVAPAIGFRPEVALAQLQLAELLLATDGRADDGMSLLETAIAELRSLGMRPALARALALRGR